MFHVSDGLFFERLSTGSVRIVKRETGNPDSAVVFEQIVDESAWCSVIASMSYYGEENYGYYRALNFHSGRKLDSTTPLVNKTPLW